MPTKREDLFDVIGKRDDNEIQNKNILSLFTTKDKQIYTNEKIRVNLSNPLNSRSICVISPKSHTPYTQTAPHAHPSTLRDTHTHRRERAAHYYFYARSMLRWGH